MVTDVVIGWNIKCERLVRGLSQRHLGEYLGVSFQQVQKYETGANHISSVKLHSLALLFQCSMDALCVDWTSADNTDTVLTAAFSQTVRELLTDFNRIPPNMRDQVCSIMHSIADSVSIPKVEAR